jgi:hypothetical protein
VTAETARQRIADLLVDRCPDHGCVEPPWSACHCELADPLLALLATDQQEQALANPDEGDELVCVDQCGFCDACGMEPFGTPAEGWREAARFLRRTPRDFRDYPAVLTGARLIEEHLRKQAEAAMDAGEAP